MPQHRDHQWSLLMVFPSAAELANTQVFVACVSFDDAGHTAALSAASDHRQDKDRKHVWRHCWAAALIKKPAGGKVLLIFDPDPNTDNDKKRMLGRTNGFQKELIKYFKNNPKGHSWAKVEVYYSIAEWGGWDE
ncbi:hypothetical protein FALBO_1596 [Fusarium albosuccineum]|uniref:Uncharacterized protein n=1 Tax=Fusarium albosuccineum TaxID=1237068 RepID=A0A8H4LPX9_9HYPO|nr:hypothetical protein FALBO_1596 [Fusarium albosuccineum]